MTTPKITRDFILDFFSGLRADGMGTDMQKVLAYIEQTESLLAEREKELGEAIRFNITKVELQIEEELESARLEGEAIGEKRGFYAGRLGFADFDIDSFAEFTAYEDYLQSLKGKG